MQKVTIGLISIAVVLGLALAGAVVYLELFVIPAMLTRQLGQAATLVHILGILFLLGAALALGGWLKERTLFKVQEKLAVPLMGAIDNLTRGKWAADSNTYSRLIDTGARMGFTLGKAANSEPDRAIIVEGISRMALPEPKQLTGQSQDVINEMAGYMGDVEARKERLQA